jgi:hypothetical protein
MRLECASSAEKTGKTLAWVLPAPAGHAYSGVSPWQTLLQRPSDAKPKKVDDPAY